MNYRRHYDLLIGRARSRSLVGYSERHHIVPRCLGGEDSDSNLVRLTPEEHYVAHLLLVKIHRGDHRLLWAAIQMTGGNKCQRRSNKAYGWLRRKFASAMSERGRLRRHTDESRAKMSASRKGVKRNQHSDETKAKMSAASMGIKKSPEHRAAMSLGRTGVKRGPASELRKARISAALKRSAALKIHHASLFTQEYRVAHSLRMKQWWADRKAATSAARI